MLSGHCKNILPIIVAMITTASLYADDPGITKVRLIQESDTSYVFELDIAAQYLWTIAPPILPERFKVSDPAYKDQSGWITVRALITTSGAPLSSEDEMILPWQRAGADITVQWQDGSIYKGLFNRSLEGIHIPFMQLMPVRKSTWQVLRDSFVSGLAHLPFLGIHFILILALVWAFPSRTVLRYLFMMTLGQMSALILAEAGVPGFDLLFADLLLLLMVFLLSYSKAYQIRFRYLGLLLFTCGALHALSYATELRGMELGALQRIQAMLAFNLAMDLGHYLGAFLLLALAPLLKHIRIPRRWSSLILGSLSVFLGLVVFGKYVVAGSNRILPQDDRKLAFSYKNYAPQGDLGSAQAQRGKGMMTTPLMVFLSVEAHELRQEILVQASEALIFAGAEQGTTKDIPVESQDELKKKLLDVMQSSHSLLMDQHELVPLETIAEFVTLSRGGVAIRESPIPEDAGEGIIGITYIYELEAFPDSLCLEWSLFPASFPFVEASVVDPHGALTMILSPDDGTLNWQNRLANYRAPPITAILIENKTQPLLSILLWASLLLAGILMAIRDRSFRFRHWMTGILLLGFLCYPLARIQLDIPFLNQGKPSAEKADVILNNLLSNVYRAFDRRNENDVYDRLATSVSGNQLTEIFMQNRQSMALENRGGARARVDEVTVQDVMEIRRLKKQGFVADTRWTVRGSVNHFGHTHYRQNQYRALVSFGTEGDSWKIQHIEIMDTRRLY